MKDTKPVVIGFVIGVIISIVIDGEAGKHIRDLISILFGFFTYHFLLKYQLKSPKNHNHEPHDFRR